MDEIAVAGIEAFGFHGVLPHERQVGQRFVTDVVVRIDTNAAAVSDDLSQTVDYSRVVDDVIAIVTGQPRMLIETVAEDIAKACLRQERVIEVEVTVHKPAAPVSAVVADISVTVRRRRS